ncbi:MAG: ribonuclease HII [Metallosphaera yellowstonensis]|jgi:ribonuclease HII|uniref:Ribonuclease n=1 Tax=Metallosphaera yellowstonensis MK1 TaxID=671065 RepID=H2C342_9CREN|nr:ribonuclease HII [Metallosphaera yellowstonensis]EHP70663.1 ribonuclease H, mammalian HI/archaeal HII subfamily [Metallosphaera yellowstonensis MK1]
MRLGIDEAGRGCLIGPMVVAGVVLSEKGMGRLRAVGVKDSKKLTRKRREELFHLILEESEAVAIAKALPDEIDTNNLNELTYRKVLEVMRALSAFPIDTVTVDRVGKEVEVIEEIYRLGLRPNVVYHADENFLEASAASIVAKVVRDRIVLELREQYGDFGSGYPSDPKTRKWVERLAKEGKPPPTIIRRTWKLLQKSAPQYYLEKVVSLGN